MRGMEGAVARWCPTGQESSSEQALREQWSRAQEQGGSGGISHDPVQGTECLQGEEQ